jgi:hypothetical protein
VDLTLGIRYHTIWLEFSDSLATTVNHPTTPLIGDIRVKVDGEVVRTHTGTQLNTINALNGSAWALKTKGTTSNFRTYLPIFLGEPWRKDIRQMMAPAWNAVGIRSFQIEVDFKAIGGQTSQNVAGFFEWDPPVADNMGVIAKIIRQSLPALGTQMDYNTLDRRGLIQAIHMFKPTDTKCVIKAKLTADGVEVHDLLDTQENMAVLLAREMTPETGTDNPRYDLILDYDDPLQNALRAQALSELTLHVEFGTYTTATGAFGAAPGTAGTMDTLIVRAEPV